MAGLIIFIKNPELGKVKTRLATTVGDRKALQLYNLLLEHTRSISSGTPSNRYLFYSRFVNHYDRWNRTQFEKHLQTGPDLGTRMKNAFEQVLLYENRAIIIGSDCASLSTQILDEAFQALQQHDFVLGPALDGGYYLLGMNQFYPTLFDDISWSTHEVTNQTLEKIRQLKKSVHLLPSLSDIDTEEDWNKFGAHLAQ